jgi:GATA-binding protein
MENITWRMMALALKKKKEEDDASASADVHQPNPAQPDQSAPAPPSPPSEEDQLPPPSDERGRRIDKGKAPVRVVGFDGLTQDGLEEQESVVFFPFFPACLIFSFYFQGLFPWTGGQ